MSNCDSKMKYYLSSPLIRLSTPEKLNEHVTYMPLMDNPLAFVEYFTLVSSINSGSYQNLNETTSEDFNNPVFWKQGSDGVKCFINENVVNVGYHVGSTEMLILGSYTHIEKTPKHLYSESSHELIKWDGKSEPTLYIDSIRESHIHVTSPEFLKNPNSIVPCITFNDIFIFKEKYMNESGEIDVKQLKRDGKSAIYFAKTPGIDLPIPGVKNGDVGYILL